MPGPSNKKKNHKGKARQRSKREVEGDVVGETVASRTVEEAMFERPFMHDPGNGPRVRDVKKFIESSFAQPIAQEDEMCREFGQKEVLEMLSTILPEDTALILWYNKSRAKSRICPTCLRLYGIGDELSDLTDEGLTRKVVLSARLLREQELSGFCSPVCFAMGSVGFAPEASSAWGQTGDEMSETSWAALKQVVVGGELAQTLGLVVTMSRLHDLGLLELCFE